MAPDVLCFLIYFNCFSLSVQFREMKTSQSLSDEDLISPGDLRGELSVYSLTQRKICRLPPWPSRRDEPRLGDSGSVSWAESNKCCKNRTSAVVDDTVTQTEMRDGVGRSFLLAGDWVCYESTSDSTDQLRKSWRQEMMILRRTKWMTRHATKHDKTRQDRLVIQKIKFTPFLLNSKFKTLLKSRGISTIL